jgi:hypothetical protein
MLPRHLQLDKAPQTAKTGRTVDAEQSTILRSLTRRKDALERVATDHATLHETDHTERV